GGDGVAVGADQDVVVAAHAEFAARQGAPGLVADPGRHAVGVLPAPACGVARRIVDLVDALHPGAGAGGGGHLARRPAVRALVGEEALGLVAPFLAPGAHHHGL